LQTPQKNPSAFPKQTQLSQITVHKRSGFGPIGHRGGFAVVGAGEARGGWTGLQGGPVADARAHLGEGALACGRSLVRCGVNVDVLGPVLGVGVMAKRPQGLLNVGDSFRFPRGW
jgi:hypothetical protein